MSHTTGDAKLLARIRRMKGQMQAVENAIESGADCAAVLQQIAAIRGAVNGLMAQVLESHVREHLGSEQVSAAQRAKDVEHVIGVLRSYLK
ncbi:metal/formaldehyde-sensitive transcriptional repressor [uncultured Oxalicibacterium sp.]|uniref:metal/formaldehyde-sensitive transcriptional repressor n=1 Tax=uncultured Oxalicibacterium sp. TaxID=1168540 RepID=UPI0025DA37CA|nr:metal/formaldehyde-sensitive transcriptional repressor [uncultured Oxalicibacterium sp.]